MLIIGIASLADKNHGYRSNYLTASNDFVISASRILDHKVLPANIHLNHSSDLLNHSLIEAYLHDHATMESIANLINDKIASFSQDILDFSKTPDLQATITNYYDSLITDSSGNLLCVQNTCTDQIAYYQYKNSYPIFAFANNDLYSLSLNPGLCHNL